MNDIKVLNHAVDNIRILAASMVEKAKSGHPGGAMGGADFINVLYSEYLNYDPADSTWVGRDRFFLDPGHMAPMLYSQLALIGKFSLEELQQTPSAALRTPAVRWDRATPSASVLPSPPSSWQLTPAILLSRRRPSTSISPTAEYRRKSPRALHALPAHWGWTTSSCSMTPTTSSSPPSAQR